MRAFIHVGKLERNSIKKLNLRCYRDWGGIINEMGKFGAQARSKSWGTDSGMDEISGTGGERGQSQLCRFLTSTSRAGEKTRKRKCTSGTG